MKKILFFCALLIVAGLLIAIPIKWGGYAAALSRADVKFFLPIMLDENKSALNELYNKRVFIAHGGGVGPVRWRNTEQAVLESLRNGFLHLEVDMLETSDGQYIGAHDWGTFRRLAGMPYDGWNALKYDEAVSVTILNGEKPLTFEFLNEVMRQYPNLILEVDKILDYRYLVKRLPYPERMMVITYNARNYLDAMRAGIRYPVFCVWVKENVMQAEHYGFPILGVNAELYHSPDIVKRLQNLHENGVTILVIEASICDREEFLREHLGKSCSGIYTERWLPGQFDGISKRVILD